MQAGQEEAVDSTQHSHKEDLVGGDDRHLAALVEEADSYLDGEGSRRPAGDPGHCQHVAELVKHAKVHSLDSGGEGEDMRCDVDPPTGQEEDIEEEVLSDREQLAAVGIGLDEAVHWKVAGQSNGYLLLSGDVVAAIVVGHSNHLEGEARSEGMSVLILRFATWSVEVASIPRWMQLQLFRCGRTNRGNNRK